MSFCHSMLARCMTPSGWPRDTLMPGVSHWCDWVWGQNRTPHARQGRMTLGIEMILVPSILLLLAGYLMSQQHPGVSQGRICSVGWLLACLTSQQRASVSHGRICSDNFTRCHTELEAANPTFYLTQSQYTDTGPTSPSADPTTPGAWQGSLWSANFKVTGMAGPGKAPSQSGFEPEIFRSRGGRVRLNH